MNSCYDISNASTHDSSCSQLEYPMTCKQDESPLAKKSYSNKYTSSSVSLTQSSKKQYVLKTCRFFDKRTKEIPFDKMFLTCLDILIVESAIQMDNLKEYRFLASFNYFKRVANIERKILQDWICVNLQYVTMKKVPIKVMQQRLCNSKNKQGQKISTLLEEQLLSYNHFRRNNMIKTMSKKQMESTLQNKFCYFLEIDQSENEEDKMQRLIYDFHLNSIYFSGPLSKLVAGDTPNLISHITSQGIPEIYSEDVSYFDFWADRLGGSKTSINSSIRTFDNYNFKCVENIQMYQSEESGTLLVQVTFDFSSPDSQNNTPSSPSYSLYENMNVYKFMKSERRQLQNYMKNNNQKFISDPFINSIYEEEKQKNLQCKSNQQQSFSSSQSLKSQLTSKNTTPCQTRKNDQITSTAYGFKDLSELY